MARPQSVAAMPRWVLVAGLAWALIPCAQAQSDWRRQAVPFYSAPVFVQMQDTHWYLPRATELTQRTAALRQALTRCDASRAARPAWREALLAWARLSAVAVGPLVERRSARRLDFQPTRPELIGQALAASDQGRLDMELVGSAAKGFAALEWLLWAPAAQSGAAAPGACHLRQALAADLHAEAQALAQGFTQRQQGELDEAQVSERMAESLNQWLGGLEQLRMQALERPVLEMSHTHRSSPVLPRALSGIAVAERQARWQGLRTLMVFDGAVAPEAGQALVPLETLLRGQGLNPLADALRGAVRAVDQAWAAAPGPQPSAAALRNASRALAALHQLVSEQVAPAFQVAIGFSDADGD